jgi:hypothetical protein
LWAICIVAAAVLSSHSPFGSCANANSAVDPGVRCMRAAEGCSCRRRRESVPDRRWRPPFPLPWGGLGPVRP